MGFSFSCRVIKSFLSCHLSQENTVGLFESAKGTNDHNEIADMTKSLKVHVAVIVPRLTYFAHACSF